MSTVTALLQYVQAHDETFDCIQPQQQLVLGLTCNCPLAHMDVKTLASLEEFVDKLRVCAKHYIKQLLGACSRLRMWICYQHVMQTKMAF